MHHRSAARSLVFAFAGLAGCGGESADDSASYRPVVTTYALHVSRNYEEALARAEALKTAVHALVTAPSQGTLDAARTAWIEARPSYEETEAFRFYEGPIDDPKSGPEGALNAWPLDENYVDYTQDEPEAGIINHATEFPQLTAEALATLNEKGGEKNLSTGYHAIEFLLWGQDLNDAGHEQEPGRRPFTDYVAETGTAKNQARRGQYLEAVTELLVQDLAGLVAAWKPDAAGSYAAMVEADNPRTVVRNMLSGIGSLAGGELSRERMNNAYQTKDQEEEHSCFSDTTTTDLLHAALGIENVYLGRYGSDDGAGLDDLVKARDAALDVRVKARLGAMVEAMRAIPAPFDRAIGGEDGRPERMKVKAAIDGTRAVADVIVEVGQALGIKDLNIDNSLMPPKE
jgi:putative iron-regulated protein